MEVLLPITTTVKGNREQDGSRTTRQEQDVSEEPADLEPVTPAKGLPRTSGGVQSVERSVALLETLADLGGRAGLTEIAARTRLPLPTIHRLLRTLTDLGLVRRTDGRQYALGPRLVPLGEGASAQLGGFALPFLDRLVKEIGETANLAMYERDGAVYLAQAQSSHSMRMFTQVGNHVDAHCTGVGKALLAYMAEDVVDGIIGRAGMTRLTDTTITEPAELHAELARIRERGYAVDDGEREIGVRCLAVRVPVQGASLALSVSGPAVRVTPDRDREIAPVLLAVARELGAELFGRS